MRENKTKNKFAKTNVIKVILLIIIALTILQTVVAQEIIIQKTIFQIDEEILIEINSNEYTELQIYGPEESYKLLGDPNGIQKFRPEKIGEYYINLVDINTRKLLDQKRFAVTEYIASNIKLNTNDENQDIIFSKSQYFLGDLVKLRINPSLQNNDLFIQTPEAKYHYLGNLTDEITFYTDKPGSYAIMITDNNGVLHMETFEVIQKGFNAIYSKYGPESDANKILMQEFAHKVVNLKDSKSKDKNTEIHFFKKTESTGGTVLEYVDANQLNENEEYQADILLQGEAIKKISLNKFKPRQGQEIGFETLDPKIKKVNNQNPRKIYSINLDNVNFQDGVAEAVAEGSELWKCKDWNFTTQSCFGTWEKLKDIIPGQTYNITLYPGDPGFAELGVASINTNKSTYLTNEDVKITAVVLDIYGYLVQNADVNITITTPGNTEYKYAMQSGTVTEESRGIYTATFTHTNVEGKYYMNVTAKGTNVDNNMTSFFKVNDSNEFEIIRNMPVTIDPWQGPYTTTIELKSNIGQKVFNFTEVLPINFTLYDSGSGNAQSINGETHITWNDIDTQAFVKYIANSPLVSPDLYEIGPAFINYDNSVYEEARPWYLAIDPQSFYDPDSNIQQGWNAGTGTTFAEIADGYREPTTPDVNDYVSDLANDNVVSEFGFSVTETNVENMTLWVYASTGSNAQFTFYLYQGTTSVCSNSLSKNTASDWYKCEWTNPSGSYTDMRVRLGGVTKNGGGKNTYAYVYAAYLEVEKGNEPPVVNLEYPQNAHYATSTPIDFNFTAYDDRDTTLSSCSLYTNFTSSWALTDTITSPSNGTEYNFTQSPSDGNYIWNVQCTDQGSASAFNDTNRTITVNANAPLITNYALNESVINQSKEVYFNVSITDSFGISYAYFTLKYPNGTSVDYPLSNTGSEYYFTITDTNQTGTYNVTNIWANDTTNQISQVNPALTFQVTASAPEPFDLVSPASGTVSNNLLPTMSWQQTVEPDFKNYTLLLDKDVGFGSVDYTYQTTDITNTSYTLDFALDGNSLYYWKVVAYDIFGNWRESTSTWSYITDNQPPNVTLQTPADDYFTNELTINFTFIPYEEYSIVNCSLYTNESGWGPVLNNETITLNQTNNIKYTLSEGIYNWSVSCLDGAGNSQLSDEIRKITIDTSSPIINLVDPPDNTYENETNIINFTANADDLYSTISSCNLIINGTIEDTKTPITEGQDFTFTRFVQNGNYAWTVNCTDSLGNIGTVATRNITVEVVDNQAPLITLNFPYANQFLATDNITFNYTPEDATGIQNCTLFIDGSISQTCGSVGSVSYNDTIVALSPTYRWPLSGNENDIVGTLNSNGGTDPSWVSNIIPQSEYSQAGDYDGSTAVTQLPDATDINTGTTYEKTISLWFNADTIDTTGNGRILWEEGGGTNWLSIYTYDVGGTDYVFASVGEGGATGVVDYVNASISTGTLYHLMFTMDTNAGELRLYLNGVEVDSDTSLAIGASLGSHGADNSIGGDDGAPRNHLLASTSGHHDGRIADVVYWAETPVLDGTDASSIYSAGTSAGGGGSCNVTNFVPNYFTVLGMPEGPHNWTVGCYDNSTEFNYYQASIQNFTLDLDAPNITLYNPPDTSKFDYSTITFNFTAEDNYLEACELYGNFSGPWASDQINESVDSGVFTQFQKTVSDGTYKWNIRCNHSAGTFAFASSNWTFSVDTTPPQYSNIQVSPPNNSGYAQGQKYEFNITWNDNFQVDEVILEHNFSGFPDNVTIIGVGSVYNYSVFGLPTGSYYYKWYANDTINNEAETPKYEYVVNKADPGLNLYLDGVQNNKTILEDNNVNITATLSACAGSTIQVYQDGTIINNAVSPATNITLFSEPGYYNITASFSGCENYSADEQTYFLTVNDTTKPIINLIYPENDTTIASGETNFQYNVTDSSDLENCSLYLDGAFQDSNDSVTTGSTQGFLVNIGAGQYTWYVECYDVYGNFNVTGTRNFTAIDTDTINVNVQPEKSSFEIGELAKINSYTTDVFSDPLITDTQTDIILGNTTYRWWNTNWNNRKQIYINETTGSTQNSSIMEINITGLNGAISSCVNEIRIIRDVNAIQTEVPVEIYSGDDSNWCYAAFFVDIAASDTDNTDYHVYYNNSGASNPGYSINTETSYLYYAQTAAEDEPTTLNPGNMAGTNDGTYAEMAVSGGGATQESASGRQFINTTPFTDILSVQARYRYEVPTSTANWYLRYSVNNGGSYLSAYAGTTTATKQTSNWKDITSDFTTLTWSNINQTRLQGRVTKGGGGASVTLRVFWVQLNVTGKIEPVIVQNSIGEEQTFKQRSSGATDTGGYIQTTWSTISQTYGNYSAVTYANKSGYQPEQNGNTFEVVPDVTAPNVTLLYPGDYDEFGAGLITLQYRPYDINLDNCTLYTDQSGSFIPIENDTSPVNNVTNNFTDIYFGIGLHTWNVFCNDINGNGGFAENNFTINVTGPDLTTSSDRIWFSNDSRVEGINITIFANISNEGLSNANESFIVQFYYGDPDFSGVQIGNNITINELNASDNITINVSYTLKAGSNNIFVRIDPDDVINESIEDNNKANNTLFISLYQYYYGNTTANIILGGSGNYLLREFFNVSEDAGLLFFSDADSEFSFLDLEPLGRNTLGNPTANDFSDADENLNSTSYKDNINVVWANNTDQPLEVDWFEISGNNKTNVPVVDSTNNSNFKTGIMWDAGDDLSTNLQYDITDKEDLVFVTKINYNKSGKYGYYDYEIKIPALLREYDAGVDKVVFYAEIK